MQVSGESQRATVTDKAEFLFVVGSVSVLGVVVVHPLLIVVLA